MPEQLQPQLTPCLWALPTPSYPQNPITQHYFKKVKYCYTEMFFNNSYFLLNRDLVYSRSSSLSTKPFLSFVSSNATGLFTLPQTFLPPFLSSYKCPVRPYYVLSIFPGTEDTPGPSRSLPFSRRRRHEQRYSKSGSGGRYGEKQRRGKGMGDTAQRGKESPVIQDVHGDMTVEYRFPVN